MLYNEHSSSEQLDQLSRQPAGSGGPWSHIESCVQCKTTLEKYRKLNLKLDQLAANGARSTSTMNCPDESVWLEVAAGTLSPEESLSYSSHAATCDACAKNLQAAIRIFDPEVTEEEERVLDSLPEIYHGTPWAAISPVAAKARPTSLKQSHRFSWRLLSYGLAVTAIIIGVSALILRHDRPEKPDVEHLLAAAYTEYRPFEMRIPYAGHAEMRQQRSGEKQSIARYSKSFRKANDEIDSALEKHPDDPVWLLFKAKLDLLDGDYREILSMLSQVSSIGSNASDKLLIQAMALYQKGEKEGEPLAYAQAIDLYGKILQNDPNDVTALFNRALACEKIPIPSCAIQDLTHLLSIEKDTGWKTEARDHLDQIKKK